MIRTKKQKDDILDKIILVLIVLIILSIGSFINDFINHLKYNESTYGFVVDIYRYNSYNYRHRIRIFQDVTVQYEVAGKQYELDFTSRVFPGFRYSDDTSIIEYTIGDKVKVNYDKENPDLSKIGDRVQLYQIVLGVFITIFLIIFLYKKCKQHNISLNNVIHKYGKRKIAILFSIISIFILIFVAIFINFTPASIMEKNLKQIHGHAYDSNSISGNTYVLYNNNCKINLYTKMDLVNITSSKIQNRLIHLSENSSTTISISIIPVDASPFYSFEFYSELLKEYRMAKVKLKPKITKNVEDLEYFEFNNRKYYYRISQDYFYCLSPITDKYLYYVRINEGLKKLTKEDIESILYFESYS